MLSPNCHHEKSTVFVNQRQCFSLSKKQYSIFMLRAAARIQSNLLCKFINSGSMYLGIYTREEKMCPQDAVFLRDSLESVVSSERLFGKRSFSTASIHALLCEERGFSYSFCPNIAPSSISTSSIGITVPSVRVSRRANSSAFLTTPETVRYAPPDLRSSGTK